MYSSGLHNRTIEIRNNLYRVGEKSEKKTALILMSVQITTIA